MNEQPGSPAEARGFRPGIKDAGCGGKAARSEGRDKVLDYRGFSALGVYPVDVL
jgi:hypothetical protein